MPNYVIILRPLPSTTPPEIRMRRLLKIALRSLDLRCIDIREADADAQDARRAVRPTIDPAKAVIAPQRETGADPDGSVISARTDVSDPSESTASPDPSEGSAPPKVKRRRTGPRTGPRV